MPRRSTRAASSGSSSNQSRLDDHALSASSRRVKAHALDGDTDSDDHEEPRSRKGWDVEQGGGGGRTWAMRSLPPTRRGGAGQDPEPLVRASKKASSSRAQGRYAPVSQGESASSRNVGAGTSDYSDLEHSPPYSDDGGVPHQHSPDESDAEKDPSSSRSNKAKSSKRATAAVAADGDGDEPKGGMTKKRWLLVGGGAVLILIIIVAVIAIYMNSKSDTSSAESDLAEDSSPSSISKSAGTSNSGVSGAASSTSMSGGSADRASASVGSASAVGASEALSSIAQLGPSSAAASASPPGAASLGGHDQETLATATPSLGAAESPAGARSTTAAPAATASAPLGPAASASRSPDSNAVFLDPTVSVVPRPAPRPAALASSALASGVANVGWTGSTQTTSSAEQGAVAKVSTTATWFAADQHLSACQQTFTDADMLAAVAPDIFGSDGSTVSTLCGAELHVWQPDSNVTISVKIGDVCNACPTPTALDLYQSAFLALAPGGADDAAAALDAGVLAVQWWFADTKVQQTLDFGFEEWAAAGRRE
ncbi:hypothetical protein JCM3775_007419 [Rhodotorula graminis]